MPRLAQRYFAALPCHPTLDRSDPEWASLWNARAAALFERLPAPVALAAVAASPIAWPVLAAARSWRLSGRLCRGQGKRARIGRFARMLRVALEHRLNPIDCYRFALEGRGVGASSIREYVSESLALPLLARRNDPLAARIVADKLEFAEFCRARCIAAVPASPPSAELLASVREDIFIKPRRGSRGDGVERWDWTGSGFRRAFDGPDLRPDALAARIRELSASREYIVQPRLRNHPEIDDLSAGSAIVFRILTVRIEGAVEMIAPIAQLPCSCETGSGWRERVLPVSVKVDTGVLRASLGAGWKTVRERGHPLADKDFLGRRIPDWSEGVALVRKAHDALPGLVAVGWDLVFAPDGPVLIEGNAGCALAAHQLPPLPPLRRTALWKALLAPRQRAGPEYPGG